MTENIADSKQPQPGNSDQLEPENTGKENLANQKDDESTGSISNEPRAL
jgi:hypothetical protein